MDTLEITEIGQYSNNDPHKLLMWGLHGIAGPQSCLSFTVIRWKSVKDFSLWQEVPHLIHLFPNSSHESGLLCNSQLPEVNLFESMNAEQGVA